MDNPRCRTGIAGIDELLGGGIPEGSTVLLCGPPGAGKTILSSEFLFNGAGTYKEPGTYISLSEPPFMLIRDLQKMSYYDSKLLEKGMVGILTLKITARLHGMPRPDTGTMIRMIEDQIKKNQSKRLVIDSITAICQSIGDLATARNFIFELTSDLGAIGCTTLLISEVPPGSSQYSSYGVEDFVCEGIIKLDQVDMGDDLVRTFQIIKMRGINVSRKKQFVDITNEGIKVHPYSAQSKEGTEQ